jgi:hypothetical protein
VLTAPRAHIGTQPKNIERDAESFAVKVLNQWRKANGRTPILPFRLAVREAG